jgi:hypothetical protein
MRFLSLLLALGAPLVHASQSEYTDSAIISIQPLQSKEAPVQLAEVSYNPSTLASEITNYIPPSLEDILIDTTSQLLRVGVYDTSLQKWKSSVSVTSTSSFERGYSPTIVLSLGKQGEVIGAAVKSSIVDAGQTRDFAPKVLIKGVVEGKKPELNRPVVLSPEGKIEVEEKEKTLLQK